MSVGKFRSWLWYQGAIDRHEYFLSINIFQTALLSAPPRAQTF